jgi:MFS family permease
MNAPPPTHTVDLDAHPNDKDTHPVTKAPKKPLPAAFKYLLMSSGVSALGDGVYLTALPLLAASVTRDPSTLGLITAAGVVPWLLFGMIGGALVDRWDRRRTMVIADLARAAMLAVPAIMVATGHLSILLLAAVAFLLTVGQIFFDSASSAYLPQLLERDMDGLQSANARKFNVQNIAQNFIGPSAGSALFVASRGVPFLADALSYIGSALLLRRLPRQPVPERAEHASVLAEAHEGISYVLRDRVLLGFALRFTVGNIAFTAGGAVLVLYAHELLHVGNLGYGALVTTEAVGGLLGASLAGRLTRRLRTGRALVLTAAIEALAQLGVGLSHNAYMAGAAMALSGAAMSATMVIAPSVSQTLVPERLIGRVSAANMLFAFGAAPVGALGGGLLASAFGLRAPFLVGAALLVVMTAVNNFLAGDRAMEAAFARARAERAASPGTPVENSESMA